MSELLVSKDLERREIVLERELRGSVDAVWRSWTTIAGLEAWWGPEGWATTVLVARRAARRSVAFRDGARGRPARGVDPGGLLRGHLGLGALVRRGILGRDRRRPRPESHAVTVEFFGVEPGRTRLVLRTRFTSVERLEQIAAMGMVDGWAGGFDRLDDLLRREP